MAAARLAAGPRRRWPVRSDRTDSAYTIPPVMPPNGWKIAGTILIAAPRRRAGLGRPVNADFACSAAARSGASPLLSVRPRGSAMIRTCVISPMAFALRAICDPALAGLSFPNVWTAPVCKWICASSTRQRSFPPWSVREHQRPFPSRCRGFQRSRTKPDMPSSATAAKSDTVNVAGAKAKGTHS